MTYTIAIDFGTTNIKAAAFSDSLEQLCEISRSTNIHTVPEGGEMDPWELRGILFSLLSEIIQSCGQDAEKLEGISLTGMAEAGCITDPGGDPITPVFLWFDKRGADEAEELRTEYESVLTCISGIRMSNVATVYKLRWLKKHFPEHFIPGARWFGVPEWAAWNLSGMHFTDQTLAIRTGVFALDTNDWSPRALSISGLSGELFPKVIPALLQNIRISPEAARLLGIPQTVRITVAGHDDAAAAYGAGLAPGVWVDSTGTAEGLIALTTPLPDPHQTVRSRMSIAPWFIPGQWALIAGIGTSGSLIAELHRQTGLDYSEIDELAKENAPFPENALTSELTPQRLAKVSFASSLTDAQKASAVYDRILTNFKQRAAQIRNFAGRPEKLVITGGHARLPELSERKSEILGGIPTESRPKPEAAAFGAALLSVRTGKIR